MRIKALLVLVVLALLGSLAVPSVAVAAEKTTFSASVIPTLVEVISEGPVGNSGRIRAVEHIEGFVTPSPSGVPWGLLSSATVEIDATTVYSEPEPGIRIGKMKGSMVITQWNPDYSVAGILELKFKSKISGPGGFIFDGKWKAMEGTGVFEGIKARGVLSTDPITGLPTMSGRYW